MNGLLRRPSVGSSSLPLTFGGGGGGRRAQQQRSIDPMRRYSGAVTILHGCRPSSSVVLGKGWPTGRSAFPFCVSSLSASCCCVVPGCFSWPWSPRSGPCPPTTHPKTSAMGPSSVSRNSAGSNLLPKVLGTSCAAPLRCFPPATHRPWRGRYASSPRHQVDGNNPGDGQQRPPPQKKAQLDGGPSCPSSSFGSK